MIKLPEFTFLVVLIGNKLFKNGSKATELIQTYSRAYSGTPVILASLDEKGKTVYRGLIQHKELVLAIQKVPIASLPFQEYTVFLDED